MQVKEYMTHGVESVDPSLTLQNAAKRMSDLNIGILPVCEKDKMVGIVTDRDIVTRAVALGVDPKEGRVKDVMTKNPGYCYEDQEIRDVARAMETRKIRRMPVMDRQNKLIGVISLGDFTKGSEGQDIISEVLEAVAVRH